MDSSSKGGRLEIFTSVCADGSCVYEASQKIFISFSSKTEAKTYMEKLIKPLLGPDVKESVSKKDNIEIHRLSGPARPGKACQITFKLIQDKKKKVFDVYIGHF
ncbi:MAG: hypothetical protein Q8L81_06380 [Bacteroidota bacterium]|nr:hypothetical protein [Bacteroidota bacterium]